jgi:uncharacterized protein YyaL (SSP411 family)
VASNQLTSESSAYLKSAAHQPVHWAPWGDAAFERARREKKPILLDIGAVWCHWCHVMDGESYEDPAVAELLNRDFVCVKVDRDERPDVDARYQRAVQALSGQGGWPLTAFLTSDGEVFFGGTYFPPDNNAYGRPGFRRVLMEIARTYREEPERVTTNARAIREHVVQTLDEAKPGVVNPDLVSGAADQMAKLFDVRYGGFGGAPKFPHPAAIEFMLARWHDGKGGLAWQREIVEKTLTGMARGGVRDHLGGGFHRYSVDERWIVPHFEKMSYDNSELLRAYLSAYQALGIPLYKEVATGIVDWVLEVMADKERGGGAFATSQDADLTFGDDGDYWTWTVDEAKAALTAREFAVAAAVFDIQETGEMHHNTKKNVLWWKQDPASDDERPVLRKAVEKLKTARDLRKAPFVDRTAYVNWNAMMAGAFLQAGAVLDRPECNELALKVLDRIWEEAWDADRGMSHALGRAEPRGMLDDNVQAAAGFLDAYESTGQTHWQRRAIEVMGYCLKSHVDEGGGYFDTATTSGAAYLATRAKPVQDAPTPSPNGVAALVLARLWAMTSHPEWRNQLDRQLAAFAGSARELALYGATLLRAIDWAVNPVTRIEIDGPHGEGPACTMHLRALQTYRPRKAVVRNIAPGDAEAIVCVGTSCSLPVATPEKLAELLEA